MPAHILRAPTGRKLRCLLFDCGETLWSSTTQEMLLPLEQIAHQRALALLRERVPPAQLEQVDQVKLSLHLRTMILKHVRILAQTAQEREPDLAYGTNLALQELGLPEQPRPLAEELFEAFRIPIAASRVLFEDVHSTLTVLQERNFLLGIVTNRHWGGQPFIDGMKQMGLLTYFAPEKMAISADLCLRKPHPGIFEYALQALEVAPEEAVMIGDSLRADIAGAQRLNIYSVWKPSPRLYAELRADSGQQAIPPEQLLASNKQVEEHKYGLPHPHPLQPDVIIEHLSELLELFPKVEI
ncbi:HAD family hydrolase [Tengunoibacter tsumagoiensis]|uniref:Haloacid dehalogenase n=1 Tax=Tengunoibacter tsumagoiensis TaxID=2014871 RepID=A0A401ZWH6_9CHLR|nr:HAD family hydrolase [Tengunoibacter tsumagoiensis]GCE11228.1 hypothetical protein KTT_10870 [Tengunoibacter tsumagoiensis]